MVVTHTAFSVAGTALAMGTANPIVLMICAIAAQLPDVDTSKSIPGRILAPISYVLERHFPHRSVTHSFIATLLIALAGLPLMVLDFNYWQALVLGYFFGWFSDSFTKSGVCAFYPSAARLVIPGNPRMRLSTGSGAEAFILVVLVAIAVATINVNSNGGILTAFNKVLGVPSGAIEIVGEEGDQYLMMARIRGRNAVTQERVDAEFEVIKPLTQNDLLVKDAQGILYRAGVSQSSQLLAHQIQVRRGPPITAQITEFLLEDEDIAVALAGLPAERVYLTGTLTLDAAEGIQLVSRPQEFSPITLQPAQGYTIARLESASPQGVIQALGDYFATGTLIVRSVYVRA